METFTERDIELWRKWMDIETVYARGKFKDEENQGHMEEGINRGVFNWGASASGYMGRALDMREVQKGYPDGFDRSKLKVSRDFGKSAHNHCVCAVFATNVLLRRDLESQFVYVFDEIGRILSRGASFDDLAAKVKTLDKKLYMQDVEAFRVMQEQQDAGDYQSLVEDLFAQAALINAGFIIASNTFGWAEPGRSSSLDPVAWAEAA